MLASKLLHFVSLTDSFITFDAKLLNSILHVKNNNFTEPLIIGAFEKRAHGFESLSGHLLDLFSVVPSFLATLLNSQLVASCHLGFLILLCSIWIICF